MSKNENKNVGTCAFCGQTAIIETIGEVSQAELDQMATDKCMCKEAQSERRKKERKEKIKKYVDKHFSAEKIDFVNAAIGMVETFAFDKVSMNYDAKTCTIWMDADSYLHIKIQHREDDELKV